MNEIIISEVKSEYDSLVAEIESTKVIIAALTAEKDDLEQHVCREIQADYDMKIGNLEYDIMSANLEIEKLKLEIDYLQAAINCGEYTTEDEVNRRAEDILRGYYEDLKRKADDMKNAQEYSRRRTSKRQAYEEGGLGGLGGFGFSFNINFGVGEDDEGDAVNEEEYHAKGEARYNEELKQLYRRIVKKLHPDMNPDATEEEKRLLDEAMKAYEEGDLERIREIAEMLDDRDYGTRFEDTEEGITGLKKLLNHLLERKIRLEEMIKNIINCFPYNTKDFLNDEEAVEKKQDELNEKIDGLSAAIKKLEDKKAALIKELEAIKHGRQMRTPQSVAC